MGCQSRRQEDMGLDGKPVDSGTEEDRIDRMLAGGEKSPLSCFRNASVLIFGTCVGDWFGIGHHLENMEAVLGEGQRAATR